MKAKDITSKHWKLNTKKKNIAEVLVWLSKKHLVNQAIPTIKNKLQTLADVGLTYITLGQSATTLSGGEAQRIKLAKELSKRSTGKHYLY